jgi:MFS family permease
VKTRWLNRTVLGIGIASFFSDLGHETATAILPMFLAGIGAAPAALGIIEGVSDAVSSFSKLASGWYSDRLRKRKSLAVTGYVLTGLSSASFGLAAGWWHILAGRTVGWFGRGIRGPVRDTILSSAVPREATARVFGFDRALDTAGAVIGPMAALALVGILTYRNIFFLTIVPGLLSAMAFALLVRESGGRTPSPKTLAVSLKGLTPEFRKFLVAVWVFGMGDFAHSLLILRASMMLSQRPDAPALAVSLYVIHNIVYAAASYPVGSLADRFGKKRLLVAGYAVSGLMCLGFLLPGAGYPLLVVLFSMGGLFIAVEDSLERAIAADMLPQDLKGTGFGVLASVNGLGDFFSSVTVGLLWTLASPAAGFLYSAGLSFLGAFLIQRLVKDTVRV